MAMADESRIESIFAGWLERRERGESVDPEEVVREHPELADALRRRFRAMAMVSVALGGEGSAPPPLRPLPEGRYGEFKVAGQGGMGIVYLALDTDLNREVAFKIVRPDPHMACVAPAAPDELAPPARETPASQAFETLKARFLQEAWVTAGLEHPGIVPVYELGQTAEGVPYYTMRFVRGRRQLRQSIDELRDAPFAARLALLDPFQKVCDTVRYAHAHGVVHRDLKPENVALGDFGEVVVLDWGLAKIRGIEGRSEEAWKERVHAYREASELQTLAGALGTPGYMAPEAAAGDVAQVDERSDIYSLGVMLYEILTGRLPHGFESYGEFVERVLTEDPVPPRTLNPEVPGLLSAICMKALARDKSSRPPSVAEISGAIDEYRAQSEVDREIDVQRRACDAALRGLSGLHGVPLLRQCELIASGARRIRELLPNDQEAGRLVRECAAIRQRALAETATAARRKVLRRVGVAAVLAALIVAGTIAWLMDVRRREAREAEGRTALERDAKSRALARARVLALTNASRAAADTEPMRALLLARAAARLDPGPAVLQCLREALAGSRERSFFSSTQGTMGVTISPGGDRIAAWSGDGGIGIYDLTGNEIDTFGWYGSGTPEDAGPPGFIAFSPAGDWILVGPARDGESGPLCAMARSLSNKAVRIADTGGERVRCGAVSPSGEWAAAGVISGRARIYGPDRRTIVLEAHEKDVVSICFSPAGDQVLTASYDATSCLFDLAGKKLAVFRGADSPLTEALFSPAGDRVLTVSIDGTAGLFEKEGREVARLCGHLGPLTSACFSPSGDRIVTTSKDGTARLWDSEGRDLGVLATHEGSVGGAAFSSLGDRVLTWSDDRTARVLGLDGGGILVLRGHGREVVGGCFLAGDHRVLTACRGQAGIEVRQWDVEGGEIAVHRGRLRARADPGYRSVGGEVWPAVFSRAGDRILSASGDHGAEVWTPAGEVLVGLETGVRVMERAVLSPDGRRALTLSQLPEVDLWSFDPPQTITLRGHEGVVRTASFSPSGDRILTAAEDGTARLWDAAGRQVAVFTGVNPKSPVAALLPSGDGVLLATGEGTVRSVHMDGSTIAVFDPSRQYGRRFDGRRCEFSALVTGGDRLVTAGSVDALWDLSGRCIALLQPPGGVRTAAFSAPGRQFVTTGGDAAHGEPATLWDADGKEGVRVPVGPRDPRVTGVTWARPSGDGKMLLVVSMDGAARICAASGDVLALLRDPEKPVVAAEFSPDGRMVLTTSVDGTARLWFTKAEDLLRLADERVTRDFTDRERADLAGLLEE
jgi:WD40 repeat protein/serine/threonine protein kinase